MKPHKILQVLRGLNDSGSVNISHKGISSIIQMEKSSGSVWYIMSLKGVCFFAVCHKYDKPPAQARGAWVTHPISNWSKAVEPLKQALKV